MSDEDQASMSIGGIALASGIPVETLRNWERRYGFPEPTRRTSGHRRYSLHVLPRLRLIRDALELGYKPSFAVTASELELGKLVAEARPPASSVHEDTRQTDEQRDLGAWLVAVERMDAAAFEGTLHRTFARHGAREFVLSFALPFLEEVGNRWSSGRLNVGHEHFASALLSSFLVRQWRPLSLEARAGTAVLAAPEGELHVLALQMAALFLALADIEVIFLGENTPLEDIARAARQSAARLVVVGLAPCTDLARAQAGLTELAAAVDRAVVIAYGGCAPLADTPGVTFFPTLEAFADWVQQGPARG